MHMLTAINGPRSGAVMSHAPEYPVTEYQPAPAIDLSDPNERRRIGSGAVRAFLNIVQAWNVRDETARLLLGGMSNGTYYAMKRAPDRLLRQDSLTRVSYIIGIYQALHALYGDALANRWPLMPNENAIFGGGTPIDFMVKGGMPAFQTVRCLLDSRRTGT